VSYLPATSLAAGAAAEKVASLKMNKYEDLQTTHPFVPIAIETSGCLNKTGLEFITELGNRLKLVTGNKLDLTYLFQLLSIVIQRAWQRTVFQRYLCAALINVCILKK